MKANGIASRGPPSRRQRAVRRRARCRRPRACPRHAGLARVLRRDDRAHGRTAPLNPTAYPSVSFDPAAPVRLRGRVSAEAAAVARSTIPEGGRMVRPTLVTLGPAVAPGVLRRGRGAPRGQRASVRGAAAERGGRGPRNVRRQRDDARAGAGRRRASRSWFRRTCSGGPRARPASASSSAPRRRRRWRPGSWSDTWRRPQVRPALVADAGGAGGGGPAATRARAEPRARRVRDPGGRGRRAAGERARWRSPGRGSPCPTSAAARSS